MAKSNEIKDLEALLSESNIDAEIESILEELGGDETAEKTGEVEETSPLKDSTTDGSVLDQDPSTKDAIDSGLDEPGVAADNEVVIPDEDKKVDVVITVEKDKEPTIDAEVDETVDKLSAELNQSELGESFTNIYNILSDNINDIDEKSFEADYNEYKDDGKECISVDQAEGKECETECLKDTDIKTDIEASKLNESDDEDKDDDDEEEPKKDEISQEEHKKLNAPKEKSDKRKNKAKKAVKNVDNVANVAASGAAAGYGIKKTADMFNDKKAAQSDIHEISKLKANKDALAWDQKFIDSFGDEIKNNETETVPEVYSNAKKEIEDIKKNIESNKFAGKTDEEIEKALSGAEDREQLANTLGTLGAIGSAALLAKTGASVVRAIKDFKGKKEKEDMSESVDFEDIKLNEDEDQNKKDAEKFKKLQKLNKENSNFENKADIASDILMSAGAAAGATKFAQDAANAANAHEFGANVAGAAGTGALAIGSLLNTIRHLDRHERERKGLYETADAETSDAIDVLKDLIDVHGDENTLIITKKGEFDKPGVAMIKVKVTKEQCDALKPEFCEEKEEVTPVVTESQVALMIARENKDRLFSELVEATALANRLQNAICEKYADLAKDRAASLNEELAVWNDTFEDKVDAPAQPLIEERYVTLDELCEILDESGYAVNEESLANLIVDIINEDVVFELNEASTAMTRAYKYGGKSADDYIVGKAIARIKDEASRKAAVAAKKAYRDDVVKQFTGERKENQAAMAYEEKAKKMQKAGVQDADEEKPELDKKSEPVKEETSLKEEVKNVRKAKTASEVNNYYTTDFSEKKDSCDKECEDKENCDCFTLTKEVENHEDVDLKDNGVNSPETGEIGADESDIFDKDESVDVKEVIVESEEFDSVAKEFLEENDYEVDDDNVSLIKEAFINGRLSELDENLTESFLAGKMYAKKAAALTAKINKKRESEKDATKELAKLDKVINKARANGVSIDYADVDGRVSLSMI